MPPSIRRPSAKSAGVTVRRKSRLRLRSTVRRVILARVLTMDDHSDDIRRPSPRIEVYAGAGRKRWPDDLKAQIAAESFEPGAIVTDVARRHGCRPQQVHDWRRRARSGQLVLPTSADTLSFVPLVSETSLPCAFRGICRRLPRPLCRRKQPLLRSSFRVHG